MRPNSCAVCTDPLIRGSPNTLLFFNMLGILKPFSPGAFADRCSIGTETCAILVRPPVGAWLSGGSRARILSHHATLVDTHLACKERPGSDLAYMET